MDFCRDPDLGLGRDPELMLLGQHRRVLFVAETFLYDPLVREMKRRGRPRRGRTA